jgi:hypothetical protein
MSHKAKILIIVGSVVGILIAIAIPSFVRSRSTSSAQACINNLRQIDAGCALSDLEIHGRLKAATQAFAGDRKTHGISVPDSVTFSELASGRYLSNSEVAAFSNAVVTVSLGGDQSSPKAIWVRVRFADGFEMAQLSDGKFTDGKYVSTW